MNETDPSGSVPKSDSGQSDDAQYQIGHRSYPAKSFPLDSDDNHHCAARKVTGNSLITLGSCQQLNAFSVTYFDVPCL